MHRTWGRALAIGAAALALAAPATAAGSTVAGSTVAGSTVAGVRASRPIDSAPLTAGSTRAAAGTPAIRHVVLVGIGGLRWSDVSPGATPTLWRLAGNGSVGSLVVSGIHPLTCPADGWLTLNAGARAAVPHPAAGPCPAIPPVTAAQPQPRPGGPAPALVAAMPALIRDNAQFHYDPQWGLLAGAPGPGACVTAAGPGAGLALASPAGRVASYLPSPSVLTPAILARCPLTVADLGNLPSSPAPAGSPARTAAVRAADRQLARIAAGLPADSVLVVFAPGDRSQPHLRAILVSGPRFAAGLLTSPSTRRPGVVLLIDLTPTVLGWLRAPVPTAVNGQQLAAIPRPGGLPVTLSLLAGQDAAAQVYRQTVTLFYQLVGFGYPALFAVIWLVPWGRGASRLPRRRAIARTAGVWAASVPAGTFLASLVPWWALPHPALVLYALAAGWAAVMAAATLAWARRAQGRWRDDPLGPAGVVAAVTLAVIGCDLITGSRLAQETPFGLNVLEAGRFYGLGNNALVIYGASGIVCAAWLGGAALRRGPRRRALLIMAGVSLFTVIVAGWPGFGAKVGGTIAMVPGFLVLLAAAAGVRLTARRVLLAAVSGVALVAVFALVNYFVPVTGHSDIGGFVGQALHGGAGATVHRKIGSNLGSLTANPFVPVIPVVVIALGLMTGWPGRLRCTLLVRAYEAVPLLRAVLSAVWLIAVLGWFAEDSGVTVPAAGLPLILPLMVVILSSVPDTRGGPPANDPPRQVAVPRPALGGPVIVRNAGGQAPDRAGWRIE